MPTPSHPESWGLRRADVCLRFKYQLNLCVCVLLVRECCHTERTHHAQRQMLARAHFTASTATDCHGTKCVGQSEPCQVNYGSSKSTTQTVLALSFKSNSKIGTTWEPPPRAVKGGGTWLPDSRRRRACGALPRPGPGSRGASSSARTTLQRGSVPVRLVGVLRGLLGGS